MSNFSASETQVEATETTAARAAADTLGAETTEPLVEAVSLSLRKQEGRQRYLEATLVVPFPPEQVWQVLTDYERLADFIPNLAKSTCLASENDRILIEQVGVQDALFLKFSARVVLEMEEQFPHQLSFAMVEGDFKAFEGAWQLRPLPQGGIPGQATELTYAVQVHPKRTMPIMAVERRLRKDLPTNLVAIHRRLTALATRNGSSTAAASTTD